MSKIEVQEDTNCWAVVPAESHGVVAVACSEEAATAYLVSHFADVSELSHEEAKKRVDAGDHDYIVTRCAVRVVFWNDCEKIGDAVERHHLDLRDYSGEAALRAELERVTAERDALLAERKRRARGFRLDPVLRAEAQTFAKEKGWTLTYFIELAIREWLGRVE